EQAHLALRRALGGPVLAPRRPGVLRHGLRGEQGARGEPRGEELAPFGHYRARGSGRSWMWTTRGREPLPVSISHGVRSPLVLHSPRPFQPAFGSSMRPSRPLAKKPIGYGMRSITICPSFSATKPSLRLAVEIGTLGPSPAVL